MRWLSVLSGDCARGGIGAPPIVTVEIDETSVQLRLAAPRPDAPVGWSVSPDGASWTRRVGKLADVAGSSVPRGLTAIGLRDRPTMLVDLTASGTVIALEGDAPEQLEVAHRWIDERSRAFWSRGFPLVLVDLPELATTATVANTPRQLANVVAMGGEGMALMREAPSGHEGSELAATLLSPGCRWAVVVLGAAPARWTFRAGPNGTVTSDVFPTRALEPTTTAGARR